MADFKLAVAKTLINEGGFQNRPKDKGNWTGGEVGVGVLKGTKYGISAAQSPDLDIENLTPEQATEIYRDGYWKKYYSEINDQLLADKLFDLGVLFGVGTAVKMLQISMQPSINVVSDGVFGPNTLATTNEHGSLAAYKVVFLNHCMSVVNHNPNMIEDLNGWINRIQS